MAGRPRPPTGPSARPARRRSRVTPVTRRSRPPRSGPARTSWPRPVRPATAPAPGRAPAARSPGAACARRRGDRELLDHQHVRPVRPTRPPDPRQGDRQHRRRDGPATAGPCGAPARRPSRVQPVAGDHRAAAVGRPARTSWPRPVRPGYSASAWSCTGGTLTGSSLARRGCHRELLDHQHVRHPAARPGPPDPGQGVVNTGGGRPATAGPCGAPAHDHLGCTPVTRAITGGRGRGRHVHPGRGRSRPATAPAPGRAPAARSRAAWCSPPGRPRAARSPTRSSSRRPTRPTLTLAKAIVNTGGGTAPPPPGPSATGPTTISGAHRRAGDHRPPRSAGRHVHPGRGGPDRLQRGAWSCTGGTLTGQPGSPPGATASCSITNTFVPAVKPGGLIDRPRRPATIRQRQGTDTGHIDYCVKAGEIWQDVHPASSPTSPR